MKRPEKKRDCLLLTQSAVAVVLGQIKICAIGCASEVGKRKRILFI